MNQSLFFQFVATWFQATIQRLVETTNGEKGELKYLHTTMLRKEFSPTLKWASLTSDGRIVAADVVSLDSSLPLKKRDSISKVSGDVPKLGMKLYLNERTMTDLTILKNSPGNLETQILAKLFADAKKCYLGVKEQMEAMFLEALSTGLTVIDDSVNVGVGIRFDFGHPASRKSTVVVVWSGSATPITDISNVLDTVDSHGNTVSYMLMNRATFNKFISKAETKELFAASLGFAGANIPTPTYAQINPIMEATYGLTIMIIERSIQYERDGVRTSVKPWSTDAVVFLNTLIVGTHTFGSLAEENFPVKQVDYTKAEGYILLSKYSKNDPVREYTSSQALSLPVINNVDEIYIMDVETAT